jgi:hypothetical protein
MTENGTWTEDDRYLASDVWGIEKAMETMTPEEELKAWRTTSGMLNHLCAMADALMLEPLILALADAFNRAREEERRAEDRLSRPEGVLLGPREEEWLRALMRRSDALGNALTALEGEESAYPDVMAEYVEIIREDFRQAHEQFWRYRTEAGIPDLPTRKNARKPA